MKRVYGQWIKSCLIVAAIFLIIALTHSTNWAALPIAAVKDKTSNPANISCPVRNFFACVAASVLQTQNSRGAVVKIHAASQQRYRPAGVVLS